MNAKFLPRLGAYFIDILIIFLVVCIINMFIPASSKYNELVKESEAIMEKYQNNEISIEEYSNYAQELTYYSNKETVIINTVEILLLIFYFVIFPYYNEGQTIGKKVFKIKIKSDQGKLLIGQLIIRGCTVYSIVPNIIGVVTLYFLNKSNYYYVNTFIALIYYVFMVITSIMILYRNDHLSLHDMITKTKIIKVGEKND